MRRSSNPGAGPLVLRLSKYERGGAKVSQYGQVCPDTPKRAYTSSQMQVLATITAFRAARASTQGTLGLVPTMGYLHRDTWPSSSAPLLRMT